MRFLSRSSKRAPGSPIDPDMLPGTLRERVGRYAPLARGDSAATSLIIVTEDDFDIPDDFIATQVKRNRGDDALVLELSPPPGRGFIAYWPVRCFTVVTSTSEIIHAVVQIKLPKDLDPSGHAQHVLESFDRCLLPMLAGVRGEMRAQKDKQDLALRFLYQDAVAPGMTFLELAKLYADQLRQ